MIRLSLILALGLAACSETPAGTPAAPETASVPALAVSAQGETLETSVVGEAARLMLTRGTAAPVEVARGVSGHSQAAPRVAVTPGGDVLVLFVRDSTVTGRRFPSSDLFLARSSDGGQTFGAPVRVNPDAGFPTGHTFADVAVAPDGTVVVSWLDGTKADAWKRAHPEPVAEPVAALAPGSVPVRRVRDGEQGGDAHHGPMDHGAHGPGSSLVVARSSDGGQTFAAPVEVAGNVCPCCRTALDAGPDGAVRVVWRHLWSGGERDPAIATSRDGGRTFGAPVRVHADHWAIDGCPHAGPSVAAGADGRVHVAWFTGAEGRLGLWHAVSADGGATFAGPTPLDRGAPLGQTRAARDGAGRVWLAWEDRRTARTRLAPAAGGDTLTVAGVDPALAGTTSGWRLATDDAGTIRTRKG